MLEKEQNVSLSSEVSCLNYFKDITENLNPCNRGLISSAISLFSDALKVACAIKLLELVIMLSTALHHKWLIWKRSWQCFYFLPPLEGSHVLSAYSTSELSYLSAGCMSSHIGAWRTISNIEDIQPH